MDANIVYDLLKEVRDDQKEDSKKIEKTATHVEGIQEELKEVKKETALNTKHMGEHMARTEIAERGLQILTDLHLDNQKRIELLEEDVKKKEVEKEAKKQFKNILKNDLKYWLTIATLVVGLATKLMGLW